MDCSRAAQDISGFDGTDILATAATTVTHKVINSAPLHAPKLTRIILLTGMQGSGKSTIAEQLRVSHGFAHFDGDLWALGHDPLAPPGEQKRVEMSPDFKSRYDRLSSFLLKFRTNDSVPDDPSAWQPFYKAMCEDVLCVQKQLAGVKTGLVVTHAVYLPSMRTFIKQLLGDEAVMLILQMPPEVAILRVAERCATQYAKMGKSVEEWSVMLRANQAGYRDCTSAEKSRGVVVVFDDSSGAEVVFSKVEQVLGLTHPIDTTT